MSRTKRWMMMAVLAGPTLLAAGCATNLREAVISGALGYVTGSTTETLGILAPIATWLGTLGL